MIPKLAITHCAPDTLDGYDRDGNLWTCLVEQPLEWFYVVVAPDGARLPALCARCQNLLRDGMARGTTFYCDDCWEFVK